MSRFLATLLAALLGALPAVAFAGWSGSLTARGNGSRVSGDLPGGGLLSTDQGMLDELLVLRGAGYPLGEAAALVGGGLTLGRLDGFGARRYGGQNIAWDVNTGLLPLRAFPLSLYASGSNFSGSQDVGGAMRKHLAYGGRLSLTPGELLPGIRAEAEQRDTETQLGPSRVTEQRRVFGLGMAKPMSGSTLDASVRREDVDLGPLGGYRRDRALASWTAADHQSQLTADDASQNAPGFGDRRERTAAAMHRQIWSERVRSDHSASVTDVGLDGSSGTREEVHSAVSVRPFPVRDLTVDADGALSRGEVTPKGGARGGTLSIGGGLRASHGFPFEKDRLAVAAMVRADTLQGNQGLEGNRLAYGGSVSAWVARFERVRGSLSYGLTRVEAPSPRGGPRTEHAVSLNASSEPLPRLSLLASGSYFDGTREITDLTTGRGAALRDRLVALSVRAVKDIERVSVFADAQFQRGLAVRSLGGFADGEPGDRTSYGGALGGHAPVLERLWADARMGVLRTDIQAGAPITGITASAALRYRVGLLSVDADYTYVSTVVSGLASSQQLVIVSVTRTFEGLP